MKDIRKKILVELVRELMGPRKGKYEEIEYDPRTEYLVGAIFPEKSEHESPDLMDYTSLGNEPEITSDDDFTEDLILPHYSERKPSRPSTFGISFVVDTGLNLPEMDICITWAEYSYSENKKWKRVPSKQLININSNSWKNGDVLKFKLDKGGGLNLSVKKIKIRNLESGGKSYLVIVIFSNDRVENRYEGKPSGNFRKDEKIYAVFQPSIRINLSGNSRLLNYSLFDTDDPEKIRMEFLYRNEKIYARGHMTSAISREIEYPDDILNELWIDGINDPECEKFKKPDLRTEFIPLYSIPSPDYDWPEKYKPEPEMDPEKLSEMWDPKEIDEYLGSLAEGYEKWIAENKEKMESGESKDKMISIVSDIIDDEKRLLNRIRKGIEILKTDQYARLAFCFANRVIWQYKIKWKSNGEILSSFKWRPFQLAFFISVIESIYDENSDDRKFADLLWIPTGGGKTETYFGIIAFTIALRRLRSRFSGEKSKKNESEVNEFSGGGTAVISRYTLRLLTVQQFKRTLEMITAAEYLRVMPVEVDSEKKRGWRPKKCDIYEDCLYGSSRFSLGLWIGGNITPNDTKTALKKLMNDKKDKEERTEITGGNPAQVLKCPICGTWLSIPETGISGKNQEIFFTIKCDESLDENKINKMIQNLNGGINDDESAIKIIKLKFLDHKNAYLKNENYGLFIATIEPKKTEIKPEHIEKLWNEIKDRILGKDSKCELTSLSASNPGYFGTFRDPGRRTDIFTDFEIYCPNPDCPANIKKHLDAEYCEGNPKTPNINSSEILPDKYVKRVLENLPFMENSRMPIPAYTVDEQIYFRCPTVVISTADKIARLAFEPRAGSLFGNVNTYNYFYGFYRKEIEKSTNLMTVKSKNEMYNADVMPFRPPELIIQDELHLIEGPLGSLYGLYEIFVESLINERGALPKYITFTATINNGTYHALQLYSRPLFQFPPPGMDINDSFFIRLKKDKSYPWKNEGSGRIYMGICAPGINMLTLLTNIYSRILQKVKYLKDENESDYKYYWAPVNYFNSIKELSAAWTLMPQDVRERLRVIEKDEMKRRNIDPTKLCELSSRLSSDKIHLILDELENEKNIESIDAIFTTSMFGTGVDIPHLSVMTVSGQPKTTSQYIQATGRIGRKIGGIVIDIFNPAKPRDLSHYEFFAGYHQRLYLSVEKISANPFTEGIYSWALGPAMVAFLRNMYHSKVSWYGNNGLVIADKEAENDKNFLINLIKRKRDILENIKNMYSGKPEGKYIEIIQKNLDDINEHLLNSWSRWFTIANELKSEQKQLKISEDNPEYITRRSRKDYRSDVVLGPAGYYIDRRVVFENAPRSLREIDESFGIILEKNRMRMV